MGLAFSVLSGGRYQSVLTGLSKFGNYPKTLSDGKIACVKQHGHDVFGTREQQGKWSMKRLKHILCLVTCAAFGAYQEQEEFYETVV
jgi:hypothetical protein